MARTKPVKTAAQAAANYGVNGSSATAVALWAANLLIDFPGVLDAAAGAGAYWQQRVSEASALANFKTGLGRAKNNMTVISAKINGVGKQSMAAGIKAAATGNYLEFAGAWMPAVANEVLQLDRTNPRGDRAANRQRQAVYDAWVDSQAGKFRVK
jgi:hypothetical protein